MVHDLPGVGQNLSDHPVVPLIWRTRDARVLHEHVARMWREYLDNGGLRRIALNAADVLAMLALLKIARTLHGEFNRDDWVDALGYVALAGQVAEEDHEQEALERRAAEVVRQ